MRWMPLMRSCRPEHLRSTEVPACQIIEELEHSKRGIYGGAIGYLDFTGNLDTCIAIRLVYKKEGRNLYPFRCRYRGGQRTGERI